MKIIQRIVLLICCLFLAGCGEKKEEDSGNYRLYYVDEEETSIKYEEREMTEQDVDSGVREVIKLLNGEVPGEKRILPENVSIKSYILQGDVLILDFNSGYKDQKNTSEILWRAAVVKDFFQISGVGYIKFTMEGEDFLDSRGNPVGLMDSGSFLENSGKEITAYQYTEMELYFADKSGTKLETEKRSVYYTSNSPIEKVVVEQLIRGPMNTDHLPTIPPKTRILNVSVSDGIAYVNLDQRFITEALPLREELPVYSIVNSLIGLGTVRQVQLSINGDTKIVFRDKIRLDQLFEKNMEYCE